MAKRAAKKLVLTPEMTEEQRLEQGFDLLNEAYWNAVRSVVSDVVAVHKSKDPFADREAMYDYLHECLDGHGWVIYTHKARIVLLCTNSEDAMEEETGEPSNDVSAQAFYALRADVMARLDYENLTFASEE